LYRSLFPVLTSWFVFGFGAGFGVLGSGFGFGVLGSGFGVNRR
jgi:hypothetical protein